jgi:hypothetical protein
MSPTSLSNIPDELKLLPQWVCFDLTEDGRKIAYTPGTDNKAASNRPREWRSFNAALKDVESGKRQHLGFCFSSSDPYVFIDLDDPQDSEQAEVFERIVSYAQRSVGGSGAHIIYRGTFAGNGRHPAFPKAGIFKDRRFCLMTGDVIDGRSKILRVDDDLSQAVHTWLGTASSGYGEAELEETVPTIPDLAVVEDGESRFAKFEALCCGRWQQFEEYRGDHSTADHAFLAMLCDLTDCNEQVRRIFYYSGMWTADREEKKSGHGFRGYVDRTIRKIRGKQAHFREIIGRFRFDPVDDEDADDAPIEVSEPVKKESNRSDISLISSLPPGLVREIAEYSLRTSFYPLQEASLLVGLTLVSGIAGRAYLTPTMSGLNLWSILVGGTSCGKDEFQAGMGRLFSALEKRGLRSVTKLYGGELVSGPAVEQVFLDRRRYISYMPEFGDAFKSLANPLAPEHTRTLNRALLNSYKASDAHGAIRARRKAQGVDGVESIPRPCLVLAGEATPESLYGAMGTRELATGFLQRFLLVDVPTTSWSLDENPEASKAPGSRLLDKLEQLVVFCDSLEVESRKGPDHICLDGDPKALELLQEYRRSRRREIMNCPDGLVRKEAINRAGLKAVRIAGILAVAADIHAPRITVEHAEWATRFVDRTDDALLGRFASGEIGSGQTKQEAEIRKAAHDIRAMATAARKRLGMTPAVARDSAMLPLSVLKARVVHSATFSTDRAGAVTAFDRCIDSMVKSGTFSKVQDDYAKSMGHVSGVLLCILD